MAKPSTSTCKRSSKRVLQRPLEPNQYVSIRYPERLAEMGIESSVGSVGESFDNALAESNVGLFGTDVIRAQGPWRNADGVEYATLVWGDWFKGRRLFEPIGWVPHVEYEAVYYRGQAAFERAA